METIVRKGFGMGGIASSKRQYGFSLLELMIALSIAALVLSVGIPSLTSFTRNAARTNTANEFLSSLHYARDLAVSRNARVMICPSTSGANCEAVSWANGWIVFVDDNRNRSVDAGESIERVGEDTGGLSLTTAEFGNGIIYRPNGRAMAASVADNSGQFTLCDLRGAAHARVLIVDFSGRPRVSETRANGSTPTCP